MTRIFILTFTLVILCSCGSSQQVDKLQKEERAELERIMPELDIDRFEESIEAFEKQDMVSRYPSDMAVFVGSSSIRFWETLANDMAPHPVLNRGFGGSTLHEVNHYFDRIVSGYSPKQIFLYCGENDIAMTYTVQETFDQFVKFIGKCKTQLPDTDIVFISMKPSPSRWNIWNDYVEANTLIKNLCVLSKRLHYVDISEVMMNENGYPDESIFIEDKLHMNASGYDKWASVIRPVVDALRE